MGKPRLPWKRGPIAWEVGCRANKILEALAQSPRRFFSLRRASAILGVSTQPLRDWIKLGYLRRDGPRLQISKDELSRLVNWLAKRAEPFEEENYVRRFSSRHSRPGLPFAKLDRAQFAWPKDQAALTPPRLARLIGCHPSLIIKAIHCGEFRARRKSPCRWEVTRRAWQERFLFSQT